MKKVPVPIRSNNFRHVRNFSKKKFLRKLYVYSEARNKCKKRKTRSLKHIPRGGDAVTDRQTKSAKLLHFQKENVLRTMTSLVMWIDFPSLAHCPFFLARVRLVGAFSVYRFLWSACWYGKQYAQKFLVFAPADCLECVCVCMLEVHMRENIKIPLSLLFFLLGRFLLKESSFWLLYAKHGLLFSYQKHNKNHISFFVFVYIFVIIFLWLFKQHDFFFV